MRYVILTGAGISAESGIRTFRDSNGLWESHRIEDVATPDGFSRNPELVHTFYNARRKQLQDPSVQPNPAHHAIARLQQALSDKVLLVTQNVDDLHERAGSEQVLHMHGELLKLRCEACHSLVNWSDDACGTTACTVCDRDGMMRPHIVWFGEMPFELDRIYHAIERCDVFVAIGTSGTVYPAAGFVAHARNSGAHTIEMNVECSGVTSGFAEHRSGLAGQLVPIWVDEVLG